MPNIVRSILAVLAGIMIGSIVNMTLINLSPTLIPPPAGINVKDAESLAKSIHLFEPRHFLMPFLAHALGTFVGACVAYALATKSRVRAAYVIGAFFLCGGIAASAMIPAPKWFMALDIIMAYIPMAFLSTVIGKRLRPEEPTTPN